MSEPEYRILDVETIQDPDTLLAVIDDLMMSNRMLTRAVAMTAVLMLHHLGEFVDPPAGEREATVETLLKFLKVVHDDARNQQAADIVRDLLDAKE